VGGHCAERKHPATVIDIKAWFAALDGFSDVPFMEDGRQQPPMPALDELFE